jgi:hypothetical protein
MVPTITTRLRTMMKAMREVVIPAVDPQHAIAQEQAKLVLGSLNLILQQIEFAHAFEVIEAREMRAMIGELAKLVGDEIPDAAAALVKTASLGAEAEDPIATTGTLQRINQELRAIATDLVTTGEHRGDPALTAVIRKIVLNYSQTQLIRERSWVAGTGFDPSALAITDALRQSTRGAGTDNAQS